MDKDKSDVLMWMGGDGTPCRSSVNDPSPESHVETLTPVVTVLGGKAWEEGIQVK